MLNIINAARFIALADLREKVGLAREVFDAEFIGLYRTGKVSVAALEGTWRMPKAEGARLLAGCLTVNGGETVGYALAR